jgi:hypothetical protein
MDCVFGKVRTYFLRNYENEELQDNDQQQENQNISYRYE